MKASMMVAALIAGASFPAFAGEAQIMNDVDAEAARAEGSPSAPANEQQQLSNDMNEAHEAVVEKTEARAVPPPMVEGKAESDEQRNPIKREGFTFELGAGVHYTTEYIDSDRRVAGAFGGSIGYFLNDQTALLLRIVASSVDDNENEIVFADGEDRDAVRYHGRATYFIGPQIQFFPIDRFMLAAGVGLAGNLETVRLSVEDTDDGDFHDTQGRAGVGMSLRAGVTVYQRKDIAALRIGVEALPIYLDDEWRISTGLVGELQIF
ncbi:MAG: hypothetical protein ACAI38_05510 [Myxococcota bacterium]